MKGVSELRSILKGVGMRFDGGFGAFDAKLVSPFRVPTIDIAISMSI